MSEELSESGAPTVSGTATTSPAVSHLTSISEKHNSMVLGGRTRSYIELSERYQMLVKEHSNDDKSKQIESLKQRNEVLEQQHGQVQDIEEQLSKQYQANTALLATREDESRRALKVQEDHSFFSVCQSLSSAKKSDVDLQTVKVDITRTRELLDEARRREAAALQTVRQMEADRELQQEKLNDAKRESHDLRRQVTTMERKGVTMEGLEKVEKQETEAEMRRLRAQVEEMKGEKELLALERAGLLREKEALLEIQGHNNELESIVQSYKTSHAAMQSEFNHMQKLVAELQQELDQRNSRLSAYEKEDRQFKSDGGHVAVGLREEIALLEQKLRESHGDTETRLQADMEAMLNMQNAAMERDNLLLKMREDYKALQATNDALVQDKEIVMSKLVAERQVSEDLRNTGRSSKYALQYPSTGLVSASTQTDPPIVQEKRNSRISDMGSSATAMSVEELKRNIASSQSSLLELQHEAEEKAVDLNAMKSVLHTKLHNAIEELDSTMTPTFAVNASALGIGYSSHSENRSPRRSPRGVGQRLGSLMLSTSFTPEKKTAVTPLDVTKSYKKTEDDLQSLRQKVSNLKLLQQQLDQGAKLMSQPVTAPVQTPASPYRSEASPYASTAIATEVVHYDRSASQHPSEWSPRSHGSPIPAPPNPMHSSEPSHAIMQRLLSCASHDTH